MTQTKYLRDSFRTHAHVANQTTWWQRVHIDIPLFICLLILVVYGLFILYSADEQNLQLLSQQAIRFVIGFVVMIALAQIPPRQYEVWSPWLYFLTVVFLMGVLVVGHSGKGAQRWLNLGLFRFQPSEIMKLAMPMILAWYLRNRNLPPSFFAVIVCGILLAVPVALVVKQPDLGTAIIIIAAGASALLLAGIRARWIIICLLIAAICLPFIWHFMHDYQRARVLTFLSPERDPLGTGYHIIQSKIAIGSGGLFGKGWLNGTQSHLQFLPEHATDFIFAVGGEELGFIGAAAMVLIMLAIVARGLYISYRAQNTFSRLLAGSITLSFFIAFFVNVGMVTGLLPVVGVPLPLVSYGGTSMVTILAGFGILMSLHTHRKLVGN
jgi:rod shape determining protein RodA